MTQIPIATQGTMAGILRAIKDIKAVLLGRVTFGDNILITTGTTVASGAIGSDIPIDHNLQRIPTGFIAYGIDMAVTIYASSTPWTSSQIFLKASVSPATFQYIIF